MFIRWHGLAAPASACFVDTWTAVRTLALRHTRMAESPTIRGKHQGICDYFLQTLTASLSARRPGSRGVEAVPARGGDPTANISKVLLNIMRGI